MKSFLHYAVILLAVALPGALLAQFLGSPVVGQTTLEATLASFSIAALILTVLSDYSYQRRRDVMTSRAMVLSAAERQLKPAVSRSSRSRVARLTPNR